MTTYLVAIAIIFAVLAGGILVDRLYRGFAARNPRLGPFRKNDGGCGCCAAAEACESGACEVSPPPAGSR